MTKRDLKKVSDGNIKINGVGNVVGDQSQSNVSMNVNFGDGSNGKSRISLLIIKMIAFFIGLCGLLAVIVVFFRMIGGDIGEFAFELILAGIATALGLVGVLRAEDIAKLLSEILKK